MGLLAPANVFITGAKRCTLLPISGCPPRTHYWFTLIAATAAVRLFWCFILHGRPPARIPAGRLLIIMSLVNSIRTRVGPNAAAALRGRHTEMEKAGQTVEEFSVAVVLSSSPFWQRHRQKTVAESWASVCDAGPRFSQRLLFLDGSCRPASVQKPVRRTRVALASWQPTGEQFAMISAARSNRSYSATEKRQALQIFIMTTARVKYRGASGIANRPRAPGQGVCTDSTLMGNCSPGPRPSAIASQWTGGTNEPATTLKRDWKKYLWS